MNGARKTTTGVTSAPPFFRSGIGGTGGNSPLAGGFSTVAVGDGRILEGGIPAFGRGNVSGVADFGGKFPGRSAETEASDIPFADKRKGTAGAFHRFALHAPSREVPPGRPFFMERILLCIGRQGMADP